jgi:hypothetical protein
MPSLVCIIAWNVGHSTIDAHERRPERKSWKRSVNSALSPTNWRGLTKSRTNEQIHGNR